jgi:hypothetical protein
MRIEAALNIAMKEPSIMIGREAKVTVIEESPPQAADTPQIDVRMADAPEEGGAIGPCPNCGALMPAIRGSKQAVCPNCGFKDSCCF